MKAQREPTLTRTISTGSGYLIAWPDCGFAENVVTNAARLWMEATAEQRPRLQRALFPDGLRLRDGRIGTAVTCMAFTQLEAIEDRKEGLASPAGDDGEWKTLNAFLAAETRTTRSTPDSALTSR